MSAEVKRWQVLAASQSKLTHLLGGWLTFGPNFKQMVTSLCLLSLSWIGAICLLLPQVQIISPGLTLIIPLAMLLLNQSLLLAAAGTDPGYLPPDAKVSDLENKENMSLFRGNYCGTCRIVKPPRARHCRICGHCCLGVDHHCPWLGTCVGVRNYGLFLAFVVSCCCSCAFNVIASVLVLLGWFQRLPTDTPVLRVVAGVGGIVWFSFVFSLLASLLSFHVFLIFRGQTTVEYLKEAHVSLSTKSTHSGTLATLPPSQHPQSTPRPLQLETDWSSGPCCGLAQPPKALAVYGCCPPPSRLLPLWRSAKESDEQAEDERRQALLRELEEALLAQLEESSQSGVLEMAPLGGHSQGHSQHQSLLQSQSPGRGQGQSPSQSPSLSLSPSRSHSPRPGKGLGHGLGPGRAAGAV